MKKSFFVSLFLLGLTLALSLTLTAQKDRVVIKNNLENFPMTLGDWEGEVKFFTDDVYQALNADANLFRLYKKPDGRFVYLYIGYYGTKKGGRAAHQPQYCYPASGWDILDIGHESLRFKGELERVKKIKVKKGEVTNLALYWNHSGNQKILSAGLELNLNRFMRRLKENRDDGAFVRVSSSYVEGEDEVLALEKAFAELVLKELPTYWPEEK